MKNKKWESPSAHKYASITSCTNRPCWPIMMSAAIALGYKLVGNTA